LGKSEFSKVAAIEKSLGTTAIVVILTTIISNA